MALSGVNGNGDPWFCEGSIPTLGKFKGSEVGVGTWVLQDNFGVLEYHYESRR